MEPLFEKLKSNAIANRQRIVLPESTEPRTLCIEMLYMNGMCVVKMELLKACTLHR